MAFCRKKNQKLLFKVDSLLNFRMWFKYGLKAQKRVCHKSTARKSVLRTYTTAPSALLERVELTCESSVGL